MRIEYNIDRSEKIIRGLSEKDIANEIENIEICKKHANLVSRLKDLLSQLESTNDEKAILYETYVNYNVIMNNK